MHVPWLAANLVPSAHEVQCLSFHQHTSLAQGTACSYPGARTEVLGAPPVLPWPPAHVLGLWKCPQSPMEHVPQITHPSGFVILIITNNKKQTLPRDLRVLPRLARWLLSFSPPARPTPGGLPGTSPRSPPQVFPVTMTAAPLCVRPSVRQPRTPVILCTCLSLSTWSVPLSIPFSAQPCAFFLKIFCSFISDRARKRA